MIAFVVVGAAAVAAALGVVLARHPVHSVLWLIAHLCSLAVLYMTLHAEFVGLVQVLLYAGAVMVLFLFVLGLLGARRETEVLPRIQPPGQLGFGVGAAVVLAGVVLVAAAGGSAVPATGVPADFGSAGAFAAALFGPYLLPFEATALGLLVAIVATVALSAGHDEAVRRRRPALDVSRAVWEAAAGADETPEAGRVPVAGGRR
jgi:NADH-quinone oxidoreductase subunit J